MSEDYSIEQLENTFRKHAQKNIIQQQRDVENFKKDYPDSELPEHFLNDFDISEALHVICREINQLKKDEGINGVVKRYKELLRNNSID